MRRSWTKPPREHLPVIVPDDSLMADVHRSVVEAARAEAVVASSSARQDPPAVAPPEKPPARPEAAMPKRGNGSMPHGRTGSSTSAARRLRVGSVAAEPTGAEAVEANGNAPAAGAETSGRTAKRVKSNGAAAAGSTGNGASGVEARPGPGPGAGTKAGDDTAARISSWTKARAADLETDDGVGPAPAAPPPAQALPVNPTPTEAPLATTPSSAPPASAQRLSRLWWAAFFGPAAVAVASLAAAGWQDRADGAAVFTLGVWVLTLMLALPPVVSTERRSTWWLVPPVVMSFGCALAAFALYLGAASLTTGDDSPLSPTVTSAVAEPVPTTAMASAGVSAPAPLSDAPPTTTGDAAPPSAPNTTNGSSETAPWPDFGPNPGPPPDLGGAATPASPPA